MCECHWCWSPWSCLSLRGFDSISQICPHLTCLASQPPASLSCQNTNRTHISQSKARAACEAVMVGLCHEGQCGQCCFPCFFQAWHIWTSVDGQTQVHLALNVAQWSISGHLGKTASSSSEYFHRCQQFSVQTSIATHDGTQ